MSLQMMMYLLSLPSLIQMTNLSKSPNLLHHSDKLQNQINPPKEDLLYLPLYHYPKLYLHPHTLACLVQLIACLHLSILQLFLSLLSSILSKILCLHLLHTILPPYLDFHQLLHS